ncbi:S8 family serine peptidase [Nocardioides flavescens]|uniref:S8 family serine peptidase n=1 Tax=Nocardioides flavescens TaxID=2691959 RepID=A0A6L7F281_9ACTN|nr:S8 family serine peptidase [Nocardioides flavescens]MXG89384.1 S8 family serine peptidase [Nocardioides flavescens]
MTRTRLHPAAVPVVAVLALAAAGAAVPGRAAEAVPRASVQPDSTSIHLRGVDLDTSAPPQGLAARARAAVDGTAPVPGRQLRLVQYAGPIQPRWYAALEARARVVSYVPDHAYLVWVTQADAEALAAEAADGDGAVVWSGPLDPAYRLAPELRDPPDDTSGTVDITLQVVDNPAGAAAVASLEASATVLGEPYDLAGLTTVSVRVPAADVEGLAALAPVVDVEPVAAPEPLDEVQGQLLAGDAVVRVGGRTRPSGPGYLAWLDRLGFPHDPSAYPQVVVVDDGLDNGSVSTGVDDLYLQGRRTNASRVASNVNCTRDSQADGLAGHGTINVGIVGGYNDGTGAANVDANGFHYGLGVSPWGRVGSLKVFRNNGDFDLTVCGGTVSAMVRRAYLAGAGLTSNSWGSAVNGAYDAQARAYDVLTRDASSAVAGNQEMLHVFAAGNAGADAGTISSPASAKNVLTVGATENVRDQDTLDGCGEVNGDSDSDIADFSSRGPTADLRVKPDLVAAGTHVQGPASQVSGYVGDGVCGAASGDQRYYPAGQTRYTWSSGTSHSTPAIAGAASLVQSWYGRVLAPGATASPAMLKALLLSTPRYLDGTGAGGSLPSSAQGYGVPDLGELFDPTTARFATDQQTLLTASGQTWTRDLAVTDPTEPVRVTLAWTDAPGSTVGSAYVNDLDLEVLAGGQTYRGNVFSGATSVTGGSADPRNNVESVFLPPGTTGPVTLRVRGTNIAGDGVPGNATPLDQDFALTAGNVGVPQVVTPVDTPSPVTTQPSLSVAGAKVREGDRGTRRLAFTVSLSAPSSSPVTFAWRTRNGTARAPSDYRAGRGTVTVPAGTTSVRLVVRVRGDRRPERDERFRVVVSGVSGAVLQGSGTATGRIRDDD